VRTDASVVIPWRRQEHRLAALDMVFDWYEAHGFHIDLVDTDHPRFNLAAARNAGVRQAVTPVAVISDADTLPQIGPLNEAIAAARTSGQTHLPYSVGQYRILGAAGTRQAFEGRPLADCDFHAFDFSCSGVFVTTPTAWDAHYGHDELFTGWAPEDFAWRITHETLLGPVPRHDGSVYAFHHSSPDKRYGNQGDGAARFRQYEDAAGNPARIQELASEYLRVNA
jgi:hypothetical protein